MADANAILGKMDNRSTKEVLIELLNEFESCSGEFFEHISKVATQVIPRKQPNDSFETKALDQLIEKHNQIQTVAQIAQEQHKRHSEIVKAKEELAKKNQEILQLHSLLTETEQLLSNALYQAKTKHAAIEKATKNKLTSEELIKYAHRISSSCAVEAPPNWMPGDPRRPYPQDIEMRSGWLGQMQERQVYVGTYENDQNNATSQTFAEQDTVFANPTAVVLNGHSTVSGFPNIIGSIKSIFAQRAAASETLKKISRNFPMKVDSGNANSSTTTWRSALNSSHNVEQNSSSQPGFLGPDVHIDILNGVEGARDELEQMSTSSSSTSSGSP